MRAIQKSLSVETKVFKKNLESRQETGPKQKYGEDGMSNTTNPAQTVSYCWNVEWWLWLLVVQVRSSHPKHSKRDLTKITIQTLKAFCTLIEWWMHRFVFTKGTMSKNVIYRVLSERCHTCDPLVYQAVKIERRAVHVAWRWSTAGWARPTSNT